VLMIGLPVTNEKAIKCAPKSCSCQIGQTRAR
jgi:hypothetical protein